jgi:hypothetical protein
LKVFAIVAAMAISGYYFTTSKVMAVLFVFGGFGFAIGLASTICFLSTLVCSFKVDSQKFYDKYALFSY